MAGSVSSGNTRATSSDVGNSSDIYDSLSKSPWFLTINPDTSDVLIWKRGIRLKGKDGRGVGPVKRVKIFDIDNGIVQVSIRLVCDYLSLV